MLRLILAASLTEPVTAVSIAAVTFSEPAWKSAARSLAVPAVFFTDSRAASGTSMFWKFLNASVTGAKASLTVFNTELVSVSVVMGVSPSSGFELWAHPVRIGPGRNPCAIVNGAAQYQCCVAISRIRDKPDCWANCLRNRRTTPVNLVLHSPRQPIGLHLCLDLRHIVPEHNNVVGPAIDVADMVAEQRLGLEAEALEQRNCCLLVDRHLHRQFFKADA